MKISVFHNKLIMVLCILISFALVLCSCGSSSSTPGDDEPGEETPGDDEPGDDEPGDDEPGDDEPGDEDTKVTYVVTVVDENDLPLVGATVQLCVGDICKLPVLTNESGIASMEYDPAEYTVKVTMAGYTGEASYSFAEGSSELKVVLTKDLPAVGTDASNPMIPDFDDNGTATVTVPAGATYYFAAYNLNADTILTANGTAVEVTLGEMRMPSTFTITNSTAADVEYTLAVTYVAGSMMNPVSSELGYVDIALVKGDADGYYYTYTATATGTVTFYITAITDGVTGDIIVTNLNTYAQKSLLLDGVDNYGLELTVEVNAGDVLNIQVITEPVEWENPAAEITWFGSFAYPLGSEQNPITPIFDEDGTAKVTVPAGATYYFASYNLSADTILTANGELVEVTLGAMRMPSTFSITNSTTADVEYALAITYVAGSMMNPESTELGYVDVSLAQGDYDGYYYTYTATADGTVTFYISAVTNGVVADIIVFNANTYAQKSLIADGVDNYGLELTVEVSAGDVLNIQVITEPVDWENPAAEITWFGSFAYPLGSEQNPIFPVFGESGTATVTVPAGKTLYFASYNLNADTILTANGELVEVTLGAMRMPSTFSITNSTTADVEYALAVTFAEGSSENPVVIEDFEWYCGEISQPAGDSNGYYYTYTAVADGFVTLYFAFDEALENFVGDIVITNMNTYVQKTLLEDGVDNYGLEVTMDVKAGDVLMINVAMVQDAEANYYPAVDFSWYGSFSYPIGSLENPANVDWIWDEDYIDATASVTVGAGETIYFSGNYGMILTVNGEDFEMDADGVFFLTNSGDEEATYSLALITPVGSMMKPDVLEELGYVATDIEADTYGYYYNWTAPASGYFTFTIFGESWFYVINNTTAFIYGDYQWSDNDPVVDTVTIFVNEGDVVEIQINTYEAGSWSAPAGTIEFSATFTGDSAENPFLLDFVWNEANTEACATVTVPAGKTIYFGQYRLGGMFLSINGGEATLLEGASPFAPVSFAVTNDSEEDMEYTFVVSYPTGTMSNPEVIEQLGDLTADITAGTEGYYYTWTAPSDGYFTFTISGDNWFYVINNMTSFIYGDSQWSDSDPLLNTVTLLVDEGDILVIQVNTYDPADMWNAPEGTIEFNVAFEGSKENPIIVDFVWNDAHTEACATVTVPAGKTIYFGQYRIGGMVLSINGGEATLLEGASPFAPVSFAITNDSEEDAEYTLVIAYPLGSDMNPEVLEDLDWYCGEVSQVAGDYDGYYYIYTATADGTLTFYLGYDVPEGFEGDIMITNMSTYEQKSLLMDGVDNYGLEVTIDVKADQQVMIIVAMVKDADGNYYPAADFSWYGNFSAPVGTEENPAYLEWEWDENYANASCTVTVGAGETVYFSGYQGMILTVNGEAYEMNEMGVFSITNDSDEACRYDISLATPVGDYNNPEVIEDANGFSADVSLGEDESYHFVWTATEDATVVITVTEGANVTVDKLTYVEGEEWPITEMFELAEPEIDENWNYIGWIVGENLTIEVVAGQQLKIQVQALTDWATWKTPAIDCTLSVDVTPASTEV